MGGIFKIIGTGLKWLLMLAGAVVWLGGVAGLSYYLWTSLTAEADLGAPIHAALAIFGLIMALVVSLAMLRVTRSTVTFLLCLVFGAVALAGGLAPTLGDLSAAHLMPLAIPVGAGLVALLIAAATIMFSRHMTIFLIILALGGAGLGGLGLMGAHVATMAPGAAAPDTSTSAASEDGSLSAPSGVGAAAPDQPVAAPSPPAAMPAAPPPPAAAPRAEAQRGAEEETRSRAVAADKSGAHADAVTAAPAPSYIPPAATPVNEADQFHLAELSFNKPSTMSLGKSYVVEASIAAPGSVAPVGLGDVGPTVTRETQITRKVRVELIANDFKVEKIHTVDTLVITPQTPGQWSWRVTPQREGVDRKMLLQVFGVLEQAGQPPGELLIKTYAETIPVTVTPIARAKLLAGTLIESWQTIAGLAGVIGGIWAVIGNLGKALRRKDPAAA